MAIRHFLSLRLGPAVLAAALASFMGDRAVRLQANLAHVRPPIGALPIAAAIRIATP